MCGPQGDGGSGPKSPIGLDVREVPNVKLDKVNAIKKSAVEGEEVLGQRLKVYVYTYLYVYIC